VVFKKKFNIIHSGHSYKRLHSHIERKAGKEPTGIKVHNGKGKGGIGRISPMPGILKQQRKRRNENLV
jgi:hypothetical protein